MSFYEKFQIISCSHCGVPLDTGQQTIGIRETERKHYRKDSEIYEDVPVTLYLCVYCAEEFDEAKQCPST